MAALLASSRCCCSRPSLPPLPTRGRRSVARCALSGGEVRVLGLKLHFVLSISLLVSGCVKLGYVLRWLFGNVARWYCIATSAREVNHGGA